MLRRTVTLLLLCAATLLAGDRAQQIADQLKKLAGQTLDRPVLFVKYGDDKFDWLVVTADGNFAAKLEGMNPDGSFNYTILGDPAKYGIKLDVSLDGVKVHTLPPQTDFQNTLSQKEQCTQNGGQWIDGSCYYMTENSSSSSSPAQSVVEVEKKVQNADLAISSLITNQTFLQGTSPVRSLQKTQRLAFVLLPDYTKIKNQNHTRMVFTEPCPDGGSVTVSVNASETEADFRYQNCKFEGVTANGLVHLRTYDELHFDGYYRDFSVRTPQFETYISTATVTFDLNRYDEDLENLTLTIPDGYVNYLTAGHIVYIRNYSLAIEQRSNTLYMNLVSDYKADCQNEWSHADTITPITQSLYRLCPTGGKVEVTNSQHDVLITFNSDQSIDITDKTNGTLLRHYRDCRSIPEPEFCNY